MNVLPSSLAGVVVLEPVIHGDSRGWFQETYRESALADLGVADHFVQDNHSRSQRGVLRGMHFQLGEAPQAKLVRCARGAILDVAVDVRRGSPTFGCWESWRLDDERGLQVYCPVGFAHGFLVLSEVADVVYRCSNYYDPAAEHVLSYRDPTVGIEWPAGDHMVSARDEAGSTLEELLPVLPEYRTS